MLQRRDRDVLLKDLLEIAKHHPGNDVLMIGVPTAHGLRVLRAVQTVDRYDPGLQRDLAELVGATVIVEDEQ